MTNPFSLASAIKFGALFAAVLLIVKIVQLYAPPGGIYVVAALAGSADVDAITLSMAVAGPEGEDSAGGAIVIAALANTAVKCAMTVMLGGGPTRRWVATAGASIMTAGAGAILLSAA